MVANNRPTHINIVRAKFVADDILIFLLFFFFFFFSEKTSPDISCESAAWQTIHMKCQDMFSSENKKKSNLSYALVVIGA